MILTAIMAKNSFRNCTHINFGELMVKLVADLERKVLACDAEWHADLEGELLADGSQQKNLWGFNYYVDKDELEYNSLINIRPLTNKSTDILDVEICEQVRAVFQKWVCDE